MAAAYLVIVAYQVVARLTKTAIAIVTIHTSITEAIETFAAFDSSLARYWVALLIILELVVFVNDLLE